MSLENELSRIIKQIDDINERACDFLFDRLESKNNDIRYSLWFQKEFADVLESINYSLRPVNDALGYAEPTRNLLELRDELAEKYDKMYDLFERVSKKISNNWEVKKAWDKYRWK